MERFAGTGDMKALQQLYQVSRTRLLAAIRKQLRTPDMATASADVLQEVFLAILLYPHHFRRDRATSFRDW